MKRSIRNLWRGFMICVLAFALLITGYWFRWWGDMPSIMELENPSSALSSEVLAANGDIMGRYFVQDRSNSKYTEISKNVIDALVATEDARFFDHSGIDGRATARAILLAGREGGGSTLTQQLAKNLFGRKKVSMVSLPFIKLKEWVLAVKLERNLTKNEIITLYLNTVPFPDNVYGIKNASLTFFNKTPDKLTVDEAAVLIGTLKGNSIYNPRSHPEKSLSRRNTVIDQMVKYEKITSTDGLRFKTKPIKLDYHKIDYHEGVAPYFRQVLEQQVKEELKNTTNPMTGEPYNIYKDGLKIYTTIDLKMQTYAEQAVEQHMKDLQKLFMQQSGYGNRAVWKKQTNLINRLIKSSDRYSSLKEDGKSEADIMAEFKKPVKMRVFAWNKNNYIDTTMTPLDSIMYVRMFLQASFMAMDPNTGEIKAWVGGINHDYYQFDHVNEKTKRQVGSTIKPLLYCLAVDNGISPCGTVSTAPQTFAGRATPYNAGGSKFGAMTMKMALAKSINNAALYLLKQVGIPAFIDFVKKCGINSNIEPYPSIALGVSDISLYEMLGAYTMFPSGGMHTQPAFITRIEDKNGIVVKNFPPRQQEIISQSTAFKMVKMMRGVVDFGTAHRLRTRYGINGQIAGKTGTTNSQADGWFIGYTPELLAGAWVGCDDRFLHFQSEALGQGAAAALPIWGLFYKKIIADKSLGYTADASFKEPENFDDCDVSDPLSRDRANYNSGSNYNGMDEDENDVNNDANPSDLEWGNENAEDKQQP